MDAWGEGKERRARGERDGARRGARGDESREKVVGDVEEEGNDVDREMTCGVSVCALVDRVVTRVRGLTEATARARDAAAKAKQIAEA